MGEGEKDTATQNETTAETAASAEPTAAEGPAVEEGSEQSASEPEEGPASAGDVGAAEPADEDDVEVIEEPVIEIVEAPEVIALREARQELDAAQARLRAVSKAYKDLQSEMESFRIRQQKMADTKLERKVGEVLERFFEPIQNLRRAMEAEGDGDTLKQGVGMVLQQFQDRLVALGVREAPGVGEDFDPNVHEALAIMPVEDPEQDGKVLHVHTTGYTVNGRAVQAAQVVIGKYEGQVAEA